MCAPQLTTSEEIWRTAGAVWWYRAALELRRTRKNVARIPLRGNSGSCNTRASGAASEKWRWAEQPKEIPEKNARKKTGFANSEVNQGEIREVCANLEKKIDGVMVRTQALEEAMGGMKEELVQHKGEIETLKRSELALKNRVEQMENYSRRNNLKLLKVPEGTEGSDLKAFVVSLIKSAVDLEETEDEIGKDIQRIHRDPFKLRTNSSRPRFSDLWGFRFS
ncbi:hypothetical protein NDU88_001588 [Pleurodeles waltl]|uniref:Uncharacterized protein n=1 Tax=Pleurodeles waltl TaxID=8319 RepID=A0AAV7MK71_PLEWA|nr:hypothetical protein NDU88_001588 [Pleurodeles waltl]